MTLEEERDAMAHAVWMVGNIDTPEDMKQWRKDYGDLWKIAAGRVEQMADRGIIVDQGFEKTGL